MDRRTQKFTSIHGSTQRAPSVLAFGMISEKLVSLRYQTSLSPLVYHMFGARATNTIKRAIMATPISESRKVVEGVFGKLHSQHDRFQ